MEQNRIQKEMHAHTDNQVLTKMQRQFNGESLIVTTNNTETIGYPYLTPYTEVDSI